MLIERHLRRDEKSVTVTFRDGARYVFQPQTPESTDLVADVTVEAHIERFLSIPEGYRPYASDVVSIAVAVPSVMGSLPESEPETDGDADADEGEGTEGQGEGDDLDDLTEEQLKDEYQRLMDRLPHGRATPDTIKKQIRAAREALED